MKKRFVVIIILIAYIAILINIMVFKNLPTIRIGHMMFRFGGTQEGSPNFVPFRTILQYMRGEKGWLIAVLNLVGNIGLLVPVGFLIPFIITNMTWKKSLVPAFASGLIIEGLQVVLRVGIFDIDDVILNGLGVLSGYWLFKILARKSSSAKNSPRPQLSPRRRAKSPSR
jgi:glycopeptide antibiotics resistance protein